MKATVTTYGGEEFMHGFRTVRHWQLFVDGVFLAGTDNPQHAEIFNKIKDIINESASRSHKATDGRTRAT